MMGIIKKDGMVFLTAPVVLMPLILFAESFIGNPLHPVTVIINHLIILVFALAPVMIVEQNEEKCDAYSMMSMLPLTKTELVSSKFTLSFVSVALLAAVQVGAVLLFGKQSDPIVLISGSFVVTAMIMLLLTGLGYLGIFKMGYTRFLVFLGVLSALAGLIPPVLIQMKVFDPLKVIDWIKAAIESMNWGVAAGCVLMCYGIQLFFSVQVFSFERKNKDVYFLDI